MQIPLASSLHHGPWCKQPVECGNKVYTTRIMHSFSQLFNFRGCLNDSKAVPQPLNCCTSNCNGSF
uniref:Pco095943 n=1 Tax=Arundo donax TaxID=35708 RepID=A0A0A8ZQS1_ARUDO